MLVDRIANAAWRTLRVRQMEQHLADMSIDTWQAKRKHIKTRTAKTDTEALTISMVEEDLWRVMHRYDTQISRDFFRSVATLERMQKERQIRERHQAREARKPAPQPERKQAAAAGSWVPFETAANIEPLAVGQIPQPVISARNPVRPNTNHPNPGALGA